MRTGACDRCGAGFVDRSRSQKRRWCSGYCRQRTFDLDLSKRLPCRDCGGPTGHSPAPSVPDRCYSCRRKDERARVAKRGHEIERLWAEGLSQDEIGERLGWSRSHVQVEMARLREMGFDLPYRRQPSNPKHPELKAAA